MARQKRRPGTLVAAALVLGAVLPSAHGAAPGSDGLIAFERSNAGPGTAIYVVRPDGTGERRLTGNGSEPAWSADAATLAFVRELGENSELFVMGADGTAPRRLTRTASDQRSPSWSRDGKRIVFAGDATGHAELYVIDADGGGRRRLTHTPRYATGYPPADAGYPMWSPDGRQIAFTSNRTTLNEVYVIASDGSGLRRLTRTPGRRSPGSSEQFSSELAAWSPDGRRIVFLSNREGDNDGELYVMDADGSDQRRLTSNGGRELFPSWSADGRQIVFTRERGGTFDVWVMDADGGGERRVTRSAASEFVARWQPAAR